MSGLSFAGRDRRPGDGFNARMNVPLPALPFADAPLASSPFTLTRPAGGSSLREAPVIFASPHSGREYPAAFVAAARLDRLGLRRSEDSFVDELFEDAPAHGAPLLAATFPRAFCDPNREPWELDPAMFDGPLPWECGAVANRPPTEPRASASASAGINRRAVGDERALQERRSEIHLDLESCAGRREEPGCCVDRGIGGRGIELRKTQSGCRPSACNGKAISKEDENFARSASSMDPA